MGPSLNCTSGYKNTSEVYVNDCNGQEKKLPPSLCSFNKSSKEVAENPRKEKLFLFLQHKPGKGTFTSDYYKSSHQAHL